MKKEKLALLGYGKTTKAIANFLGNGCIFFDDNISEDKKDEFGNILKPTDKFNDNDFDIKVTTPSIPPQHKLVNNTDNLLSEYDLFLSPNNIVNLEQKPFTIWISGTNGKTTTTQMLTHLLKSKGAVYGGNIGTPLGEIKKDAPIWILETSSFTLHHTKYASPNIYLLLPITPDHLDWHGDAKSYEEDKLKPLKTMQEGELALVPKGLNLPQSYAWVVEYEGVEDIAEFFHIEPERIKFKGAFLLDAILALAITKALFDECDYNTINSFKLDAHRQEEIYDKQGRLWVNDSKATNVDAALQAIKLYKDKKIHLILGGDDKGVDLNAFFSDIKAYNITIYAIGSNTQKLLNLAKEYNLEAIEATKLQNALPLIDKNHTLESVALLAPAASSLDQFTSYAQRGDIFKNFAKQA